MKQIKRVQVDQIRHGGIFVHLEDGRNGYIRRREISWDRRIGYQPKMPSLGEWVDAVVLEEDTEQGVVFLSLRELDDPWEVFKDNPIYHPGQIVIGEVVNIRSFAAYLQLSPGIEAVLFPEDALLAPRKTLADELVVGDQIAGWIKTVDLDKRLIRISLVEAQKQIRATSDNWQLLDRLLNSTNYLSFVQDSESKDANNKTGRNIQFYHSPIPVPDCFLIIDDDPIFLAKVCTHLESEFKIPAHRFLSSSKMEEYIRAQPGLHSLALIDYYLQDENGIDVANRILALTTSVQFAFMSRAPNLPVDQLKEHGFDSALFIDKQVDNVVEWVDRLFNGYVEVKYIASVEDEEDRFVRELEQAAFSNLSLTEKLNLTLKTIRGEIDANYLILIELEPIHHHIRVVATEPLLTKKFVESTGGLDYSQARNVIEDEYEFHSNVISNTEKQSRYKNLFPLIRFQSCLGIPVTIPDRTTQYALFLLDRRAFYFGLKRSRSSLRVRQARLSARYLGLAIEREGFLEQLRTADEKANLGELMADMFHELWGKQGSLALELGTLDKLLNTPDASVNLAGREEERHLVKHIIDIDQSLKILLEAYQHLLNQDFKPIDIPSILDKVFVQLRHRAKEQNIELRIESNNELPQVWGVKTHLEQVILNITLNGIQQIERFQDLLQRYVRIDDARSSKQANHLIRLKAAYEQPTDRIKIIISDTGPGIHRMEQDHIFKRGVSNRNGLGLGLTISRNLIERMHGHLHVQASILYVGCSFLVDLPAYHS